jgi:hypothetical protein
MAQDRPAILVDAVARGLPVSLTVPEAGQRRIHHSRFLINSAEGIWIEHAGGDPGMVNTLIQEAVSVAVAFRVDQEELSFAARVLRFEPALPLNDGLVLPALLLAFPDEIHSRQRRTNYRVNVGSDDDITFRIWRIAENADLGSEPVKASEIPVTLKNLSAGGAGFIINPLPPGVHKPVTGLRLRVQVRFEDSDLIIAGRLTWPGNDPGGKYGSVGLPAGIRFEGLDADLAARQTAATLTRVIGQLQRRELRRNRLGAA